MDQIPRWQSGVIDGMTGGLFGFILMVFSIEIAENALIDLHFIPIMLLILFEETFSAVIGSFLIIIGRFILGETTSFAMTTPVLIIALLAGFLLIHKLYQPNQFSYFKNLIMILFSNIVFIAMMMIHFNAFFQLLRFVPVYGVVSIVGGLTAFFFLQYLIKAAYLFSKYQEEIRTDFLTGLYNMRSFETVWNPLIHKTLANEEKLTLLTIDIDHFKQINDTYGHPAGNQILKEFSNILRKNIRSLDIAFRNGGDEFSIILPGCTLLRALDMAEKIRKEVEEYSFQTSNNQIVQVTVSIGAVTYPDNCINHDRIIYAADEYLYKAKQLGRNKVYPSPLASPIK